MADISNLVGKEPTEREEFVLSSEKAVFFCFPKKLTKEQLSEVEVLTKEFLDKNNDGEGFIVYTLGYGNACEIIERLVNESKAFYKVEKIRWEDAKKGRKPLFDALTSALRKSEVVLYIDDNLYTTKWLKNKVTEDCIEYRLKLMVRRLRNEGTEDMDFIKSKLESLRMRVSEALEAYLDHRPIMKDDVYDKLKYELNKLEKDFPQLGV